MPVSATCQHCGRTLQVSPSRVARFRYCSKACYDAVRGVTDEQRIGNAKRCISEWQQRNPDRVKAIQRRHYETHTEKRKENSRKWREANQSRDKARNRAFYHSHKQKRRAYLDANRGAHNEHARLSRRRHPERVAAYARRYRAQKPHILKAISNRRRARKLAAGGSFTAGEWRALCVLYDHTCLCCGRREPEITLVADHVVPLSKNGSNDIGNIQPLCFSCNSRKYNRTIDYRTEPMSTQHTLWELLDNSHPITGQDESNL